MIYTFAMANTASKKSDNWAVRDTRGEKSLAVGSSRRASATIHRNAKTGSFASQRSAARIRDTSARAADSLKRLAKR